MNQYQTYYPVQVLRITVEKQEFLLSALGGVSPSEHTDFIPWILFLPGH